MRAVPRVAIAFSKPSWSQIDLGNVCSLLSKVHWASHAWTLRAFRQVEPSCQPTTGRPMAMESSGDPPGNMCLQLSTILHYTRKYIYTNPQRLLLHNRISKIKCKDWSNPFSQNKRRKRQKQDIRKHKANAGTVHTAVHISLDTNWQRNESPRSQEAGRGQHRKVKVNLKAEPA